MLHKLVDGKVVDQGIGGDACLQHKAFKRCATAEGNIDLTVGESLSSINDDFIKSESLALVDSDRPSQAQRNLCETADFFLFNVLVLSVDGELHILPLQLRHGDALTFAFHGDGAILFVVANQPPDFTVVESLFRIWVVFDKHHLCPDFQLQFFLGGIGVFRESAVYFCLENQRFLFDGCQFRLVDLVGLVVVRG